MNTSPRAAGKGRPRPASAVLLVPTASTVAWLDQAACAAADPEIFFPASGEPDAGAKQYCASCPVRDACREYALAAGEEHGVWGGLNEAERRAIHAKARREKAPRPLG